jgi:hypothetical protein
MPEAWSRVEVEAVVADYLTMLAAEIRGERYNKAAHRRALSQLLSGRSASSIEFKHQNISAILISLGYPYIRGYKPASNYQRLLADVVLARVLSDGSLNRLIEDQIEQVPAVRLPSVDDILRVLVDPPKQSGNRFAAQYDASETPGYRPTRLPINHLEREARSRALGLMGEEFVVRYEQARLVASGLERLASKVEHIALKDEGRGYDIVSFEADSRERLIEVKTTRYGEYTPFFISRNEVRVSGAEADRYRLYRLYEFSRSPKLFTLEGSIAEICNLDPVLFRATVA